MNNTLIEFQSTIFSISKNQVISSTNYENHPNKDITQYISQSEYNYKTNYFFTGNNENIYQGVVDHVILNMMYQKEKK